MAITFHKVYLTKATSKGTFAVQAVIKCKNCLNFEKTAF